MAHTRYVPLEGELEEYERTGEDISDVQFTDDDKMNVSSYDQISDTTGMRRRSRPKVRTTTANKALTEDMRDYIDKGFERSDSDSSDEEISLMDYDVLQAYRKRSTYRCSIYRTIILVLIVACFSTVFYYLYLVVGKFTVSQRNEPNVNVMLGRPYTQTELNALRGKSCTNCDEIGAHVGMPIPGETPYKPYGYDTQIDYSVNCYVVYPNELGDTSEYKLIEMAVAEAIEANITEYSLGTVFLTHTGPCGVCSSLDDLYVYLSTPDLTNPVRACGLKTNPESQLECIKNIGFSEACSWIWVHNTRNTKQSDKNGGCFGTCVIHITSDNNDEKVNGGLTDKVKNLFIEENPCAPDTCLNTINGRPACSAEQWQDGPYRLNACIACDECRSGPVFQKVSGRTRRNSGISSAIVRPPGYISEVYHLYGNRSASHQ